MTLNELLDPSFKPAPKAYCYTIRARKADGKVWGYVGGSRVRSFGYSDDQGSWDRAQEWADFGNRA